MNLSALTNRQRGNTAVKQAPADYVPTGMDQAQWLTLKNGPDAGKKLFFYDVNIGPKSEPEITLCFVHGNPESSYTYRKIIAELERHCDRAIRIIAMDHIGFGLSDQASFEMVDMHHAENLKELIQHLDLTNVCLIVHDWGGAIGIGAFIDQAQRVSQLVILNTTVFPVSRDDSMVYDNFPLPGFLSWNSVAHWAPNALWPYIASMVVCSKAASKISFAKAMMSFLWRRLRGQLSEKETLYIDMFNTPMNSRSSRRNAKQTHRWGHGYEYFDQQLGWQDNSDFYQNIQSTIAEHWGNKIPALGFFGQWDVVAKPSVIKQWVDHLPQLEGNIHYYADCGHFVEEWEYEDIAKGIINSFTD